MFMGSFSTVFVSNFRMAYYFLVFSDVTNYFKCNFLYDLFEEQESILGKIHLELCKYHEMGRFLTNENDEFNQEAAFFHLKQAAHLGVIEALVNMAKIYLQLTHDILPNFQVEVYIIKSNFNFKNK